MGPFELSSISSNSSPTPSSPQGGVGWVRCEGTTKHRDSTNLVPDEPAIVTDREQVPVGPIRRRVDPAFNQHLPVITEVLDADDPIFLGLEQELNMSPNDQPQLQLAQVECPLRHLLSKDPSRDHPHRPPGRPPAVRPSPPRPEHHRLLRLRPLSPRSLRHRGRHHHRLAPPLVLQHEDACVHRGASIDGPGDSSLFKVPWGAERPDRGELQGHGAVRRGGKVPRGVRTGRRGRVVLEDPEEDEWSSRVTMRPTSCWPRSRARFYVIALLIGRAWGMHQLTRTLYPAAIR